MVNSHIFCLKSFDELRFNLGKKTLTDFLKGNPNPTISRNNLDELNSYGSLYMKSENEILEIIEQLLKQKYLEIDLIQGKYEVICRTNLGKNEIYEKKFKLNSKSQIKLDSIFTQKTKITKDDEKLFLGFDFFLNKFNLDQKKAIISNSKNILCIAGAGSGKTTVLTKRIEFLTKFKSIKEKEILAITFTKKAKEEMINRLKKNNLINTSVETFNSFCEKILQKNGNEIYGKNVKILKYSNKIKIVSAGFKKIGTNLDMIAQDYFNKRQLKERNKDELFFVFVNDIFSIIDFYKNQDIKIEKFYENEKNFTKKRIAKIIYEIAKFTNDELLKNGFRDFSDQVLDVLKYFRKNPNEILNFKYILVDEFQDVNHIQFELLKILKKENFFAVGDPRQAIYGWRGSNIKYILNFNKEFNFNLEIINLKTNYRSNDKIVNLFNLAIKPMKLLDLEIFDKNNNKNEQKTFLIEHSSEIIEKQFVLESIKNSNVKRCEIFVLARTNKILNNYADFFSKNGIKFSIKSEEEYKNSEAFIDEIVLATVHSIKGMEAKIVYLINCNSMSFPNRTPDNFIFSLIKKNQEYDKDDEELRLFYVALSRAKDKLIISFTGKHTKFITNEMLKLLKFKSKNKSLFDFSTNHKPKNLDNNNTQVLKNMLKNYRQQKADENSLPLYMILSNMAIDDLTMLRPQSKSEMFNVKGMGEMKIAKYGEEILQIING